MAKFYGIAGQAYSHKPSVNMAMEINMRADRFTNTPAFIICFTEMYPLANNIALGGVEMGIIKAQLAAKATGMARMMGLI